MNQAFTTSSFDWPSRRNDAVGEYIGDHVAEWTSDPPASSLQNFMLAGVGRKLGGAPSVALELVRQYLNPLAWPLDSSQRIFDSGDLLEWANEDMRDTVIAGVIEGAIEKDLLPIVMQSEAQAGYGLFAGACLSSLRHDASSFPGYIRLSPVLLTLASQDGQSSVGSSMCRLSKRCGQEFQGLQLGVQEAINPKSAWVEAAALGINALTLAACEEDLLLLYLQNFCKPLEQVILSVDLDVLSEPYAPGDHRGTTFGLNLDVLLPAIRWMAGEGKLLGIEVTGIGLEQQHEDRRPRLAASLTQDLLSHWF
ncbi:MAG: arginase family protein [Saprospiraceae bacterium]